MHKLTKFHERSFLACVKADWFNTVARWLNGMKIIGGEVVHTPDGIIINPFMMSGSGGTPTDFNWNVTGTGLTLTVTPGAVELGPDTVIEWADITGHAATITVSSGTTTLWIWVNVDMENEAATMLSGSSVTALDSTEQKTIRQKRIACVTWSGDVVTNIARAQCGNIDIPRA